MQVEPIARTSRENLFRRLLPLAYGLAAVLVFVLFLSWLALKVQVSLSGFLNAESIWSKAQKQAVIDLDTYAASGQAVYLDRFRSNYTLLASDAKARDSITSGHFSYAEVSAAFSRGDVMPSAKQGMIYLLQYFSSAPYVSTALQSWRATDAPLRQLKALSGELSAAYARGAPSAAFLASERRRIYALNGIMKPQSDRFSLAVAEGVGWVGRMLFLGVFVCTAAAFLLWLLMVRRFLSRMRGTEKRYQVLFDQAADAIVMIDEESGGVLDVNQRAAAWSGKDPGSLIGQPFAHLFEEEMAPWDSDSPISRLRASDGSSRPVEAQSSLVAWGEGRVRQAILRDVSERVAMDQERRIAAEALGSIAEGVIIADPERRVLSVNRAHVDMTGYTAQLLKGQRFDAMRSLADGSPLPESVWSTVAESGNWVGEVLSHRRDGGTYPELLSITAIRGPGGNVQQYVAVFTNISTAKANRERLEHLATHDVLTGLANRSEFERHCDRAIREAAERRTAVAVLFVDLDNFKIVNDSFSHAIGDRLLVKVAGRIQRQLPDHALAGRIGGDEFTVLLTGLTVREEAASVAQRLNSALSEPFVLDDYDIVLSASIGVAGYPLDGADTVELVANADAAMYAAKTEERNACRFYSPRMHADARRRLMLASDLRMALLRDEFRLVYQPSVDMRSGRILGVEALLRWRHPERGDIAPAEFIPLAERLGLIRRIDEWVMQAVCRQVKAWQREGVPPFRVGVNVSAVWFGHPGFVEALKQTLQPHELPEDRILLEITESAILGLGLDTDRTMHALKSMGIKLAIDDFGTGYSSLAYLKLPSVAYLKIDRSFVDGLPDSENDAAIVEAMLAISRSLGLCTIAEGVENEAQHAFLQRAGCPEAQGYLYARPMPPEEISALLKPGPSRATPRLSLVPPVRG